jgi:hypothetical protein
MRCFFTHFCIAITSHLDTVSCWKGLSYSQASELMVWYHIFTECLTYLVEEALRDVVVEELLSVKSKLYQAMNSKTGEGRSGTEFFQAQPRANLGHRTTSRGLPGAAYAPMPQGEQPPRNRYHDIVSCS